MIQIISKLKHVQGFPKPKMCYVVNYSSKLKIGPYFCTKLYFVVPQTYKKALKTISADRPDPQGKNEMLFMKIKACIWSPEPFQKNVSICMPKNAKIAISHRIQKWFAPFGPDFYAIFKMGLQFSVPQKLAELLSNL